MLSSSPHANGVDNYSKIHSKSADGVYEWAVHRIVHMYNIGYYMSKLEYPCESTSDLLSSYCFGVVLPLINGNGENLIEESPQTLSEEKLQVFKI